MVYHTELYYFVVSIVEFVYFHMA